MKNRILIIIILFLTFVASSGCINKDKQLKEQVNESGNQQITPLSTPMVVPVNLSNETSSNATSIATPPQVKEFPRYNLYVTDDMEIPAVWGTGGYEINNWRIKIMNQQKEPLSIKAQVLSGEQILEEYSFMLEEGSTKEFPNNKRYVVNNTNFTLRMLIQGYEPLDYKFNMVTHLN